MSFKKSINNEIKLVSLYHNLQKSVLKDKQLFNQSTLCSIFTSFKKNLVIFVKKNRESGMF